MYSEYTRNQILALFNAEKTPTEIVTILREENIVVVRTTVTRIIRRNREKRQGQQLQDHRRRPPKASSPTKRKIDEVYRQDPEVTASELKNVLENELKIRIGITFSYLSYLFKLSFSSKKEEFTRQPHEIRCLLDFLETQFFFCKRCCFPVPFCYKCY